MSAVKDIEFTQIAADWDSITLGEENPQALLAIRNGLTTKQEQEKGEYKVSRIETIGGGWIDETRVRYASDVPEKDVEKYRIQKGDILFSHINSDPHLGKTGYADRDYEDLLHGMNLLLIRANPQVFEPEFLNRIFQYYREIGVFISICSRSVNQSSINQAKLKAVEVPLPPLPEQKKIAHILSTVQRAIEAQERIIQTTTELKKALMHKLFTEGLRYEPQKQTEIGPVPESWEVVKLGKHIQIAHGYAFKGEFFVTDGPTVLTPGNFKLDGGLYWGKRTKYTTESYEPNVVLNPGELVVVMTDLTPTAKLLGGPAFIPEGRTILHNQRIGKVELKGSKTTLQFLYWVFLSESFKRYMRQTATGSTVRHTSPSKIYQYAFGLPSLEEQAQAVDCLAKVDAKLANAEDKKKALEDLFRTLLHELMTAKTRVQNAAIEF